MRGLNFAGTAAILLVGSLATVASADIAFFSADQLAIAEGNQTLELSSIAAADLDDDGFIDLVVGKENFDLDEDTVSVPLNDGSGAFVDVRTVDVRIRPSAIVIEDFNGDGAPDLAVALRGSDFVAILLGDNTGDFVETVRFAVGDAPGALAVADLDGENGPDIICSNENDQTLSVLLNQGDGTFGATITVDLTPDSGNIGSPGGLAVGDFDEDGNVDVAVAIQTRDEVAVLLGVGDGTFDSLQRFQTGRDPVDVATEDFDGDGHLDLATANSTAPSISLLFGEGNGSFQPAPDLDTGDGPAAIIAQDLDGDGEIDLATADREADTVSVHLNGGGGLFMDPETFDVGGGPVGVVAADFDEDGFVDIATVNSEALVGGGEDISVLFGRDPAIDITEDPNMPGDPNQITDPNDSNGGGPIIDPNSLLGPIGDILNFDTNCGSGCGPMGVAPLAFTLLGVVGMKSQRRRW